MGQYQCELEDGTTKLVDAKSFIDWALTEGRKYPAVSRSQQLSLFTGLKVKSNKRID